MIKFIDTKRKQRTRAFTLIEVVISVAITGMIVMLLAGNLQLTTQLNQKEIKSNKVALCYVQLNEFLQSNGGFYLNLAKCSKNKINFTKRNPKDPTLPQTYELDFFNNKILRVQGTAGGHMPLMTDLYQASFSSSPESFTVKINEANKIRSDLVFRAKTKEEVLPDVKKTDPS